MAVASVDANSPAAATSSLESIFGRRIQFHTAKIPYCPISNGGGFHVETLNPTSDLLPRAPAPEKDAQKERASVSEKRAGGVEFFERGTDPEISFRISFRRIGAGLANLGNTCFLNSVLQCLTYTEPFAAYLQSGKHKSSCHTAGFCALCALQNHVMTALHSTGKILSPFHLVKNLRCISRNFRQSRQEDAHEYMVNLLESIHKCCLPSGIHSESPGAYEKSLVHRIFGGSLRSQVKCTQCSYCSDKFEPFLDLSLDIIKADSLRKALQSFTSVEVLDDGKKEYQCQRCKQKVRAFKRLTIHKAPHVLTVHLKRFSPQIGAKIDKKIDFETTLDLKPYASETDVGGLKYSLYGVLVHAGWTTHSGHYFCFVRTSSGLWHSLDDNQVCQVSEKIVLSQKAYMLFYVRDIVPPLKTAVNGFPLVSAKTHLSKREEVHSPVSCLNGPICNGPKESVLCSSRSDPEIAKNDASACRRSNIENSNLDNHMPITPRAETLDSGAVHEKAKEDAHTHCPTNGQNSDSHKHVKITSFLLSIGVENNTTALQDNLLKGAQKCINGLSLEVHQTKPNDSAKVSSSKDFNDALITINGDSSKELTARTLQMKQGNRAAQNENDASKLCEGKVAGLAISKMVKYSSNDEVKNLSSDSKDRSRHMEGVVGKDQLSAAGGVKLLDVTCSTANAEGTGDASFKDQCRTNSYMQKEVPTKSAIIQVNQKCGKRKKHPTYTMIFGRKHLLFQSFRPVKSNKKLKKAKTLPPLSNRIAEVVLDDSPRASTSKEDKNLKMEHKYHKRKQPIESLLSNGKEHMMNNGQSVSRNSDVLANAQYKTSESVDNSLTNLAMPTMNGYINSNDPRKDNDVRLCNQNGLMMNGDLQDADGGKNAQCEGIVNLLTRGLTAVAVPRWNDAEPSESMFVEESNSGNHAIGYVLDEWDEEYDRGRRKKLKAGRQFFFDGSNPFQEAANEMVEKKARKLKTNPSRWGNQPFRI